MDNLSAVISAFGLVFVAELGDKTQLAVVTQTCRFRRRWAVFLGASVALVVATGLGATAGNVVARFVPPAAMRYGAAGLFVTMGLATVWRMVRSRSQTVAVSSVAPVCDLECQPVERAQDWWAFGSTLGLLFVAELGDKTQLAVLGLAGREADPWAVFAGGGLALVAITALGVLGGEQLVKLVPERTLMWLSAVAFLAVGILMGAGVA
jgi:putative Ca2+/H+ antiporter (TMEM165/GDT1 family)